MSQRQRASHTVRNVFWAIVVGLTIAVSAAVVYLMRQSIPVLQPAGPIAAGEMHLMVLAFLLMLIVVLPVFGMAAWFAWRYRESNTKALYMPEWDHSRVAESIWWLVPAGLIAILGVVAWQSSHQYDPYRPIASQQKPLTVQVVALDWRWLFIYPEQHVASINQLVFPVNQPLHLEITADAPMNSFWLPQLSGQIYAMPGMVSQLNLMASRPGTFTGRSANISGRGFSDMQFQATATSQLGFDGWVTTAAAQPPLSPSQYNQLAKPSTDVHMQYFSVNDSSIFATVVNKYQSGAFVQTAEAQ